MLLLLEMVVVPVLVKLRKLAEKSMAKHIVTKEECVGHVQKCMGARLREYKHKNKGKILGDGKSVGGEGRFR